LDGVLGRFGANHPVSKDNANFPYISVPTMNSAIIRTDQDLVLHLH